MDKRAWHSLVAVLAVMTGAIGASGEEAPRQAPVTLRYRIEQLDDNEWEAVKEDRTFKGKQEIRFRFLCNVAGTLYVLNGTEDANLAPIFAGTGTPGLRGHLGLGSHIEAGRVNLWPRPHEGSAIRFTGHKGRERFLFVFVPDDLNASRDMLAIVPGAEGWDFEAKTTYTATAKPGEILFHYFELKSK